MYEFNKHALKPKTNIKEDFGGMGVFLERFQM